MKKLGAKGQKWLKTVHIFFVCLWVGGAITLALMNALLTARDGMELYGINISKQFVDYYIIIPGANGCLLTGLLFSIWTGWGWFKHRWITVKWVITLFGIIFGTFWLGPWVDNSVDLAKEHGLAALEMAQYIQEDLMLVSFGSFQTLTVIFAMAISTLKPWKRQSPSKSAGN